MFVSTLGCVFVRVSHQCLPYVFVHFDSDEEAVMLMLVCLQNKSLQINWCAPVPFFLRWWWVMLGWMHYHLPVHHCINLLSDALCGSIFRGKGGKASLRSWLAVLVQATLGIVPPCCCLLWGQSSKCHGTSGFGGVLLCVCICVGGLTIPLIPPLKAPH